MNKIPTPIVNQVPVISPDTISPEVVSEISTFPSTIQVIVGVGYVILVAVAKHFFDSGE
jgi:hypothetical protein